MSRPCWLFSWIPTEMFTTNSAPGSDNISFLLSWSFETNVWKCWKEETWILDSDEWALYNDDAPAHWVLVIINFCPKNSLPVIFVSPRTRLIWPLLIFYIPKVLPQGTKILHYSEVKTEIAGRIKEDSGRRVFYRLSAVDAPLEELCSYTRGVH